MTGTFRTDTETRLSIGGEPRRYIGDGVYAGFDGYQIWLHTLGGAKIALEPGTLAALVAYDREVRAAAATAQDPSV